MKKLLLPLASIVLLSGCMSTKLVPPPSDFVGSLPDEYKVELKKLNNQTSVPFEAGVQNYFFDEERSLLTIIYRLRNSRWYWSKHKSEVEKRSFPATCEGFEAMLNEGLGVRYWYSGNGGFVTDIVTKETCLDLN